MTGFKTSFNDGWVSGLNASDYWENLINPDSQNKKLMPKSYRSMGENDAVTNSRNAVVGQQTQQPIMNMPQIQNMGIPQSGLSNMQPQRSALDGLLGNLGTGLGAIGGKALFDAAKGYFSSSTPLSPGVQSLYESASKSLTPDWSSVTGDVAKGFDWGSLVPSLETLGLSVLPNVGRAVGGKYGGIAGDVLSSAGSLAINPANPFAWLSAANTLISTPFKLFR